jgi:hypothetical protein
MTKPHDTIHWRLRRQLLFLFEVDADALAKVVPPQLEAVEVRPGIALMGIECLHYRTGHFGEDSPEFYELVFAAAVQPNLGIAMPVPRYCMHGVSIFSNSKPFIDDECKLLFSSSEYVPGLRFEISEDGTSCDVFEGDRPIVRCKNTNPAPTFDHKVLWGQFYVDVGGLAQGIWRWEGELCEHMRKGDAGEFFEHRFFKGLDLSRIRGCYRQMSAKAEASSMLSRWLPGVVPDLHDEESP